jgi:hypothetical protein
MPVGTIRYSIKYSGTINFVALENDVRVTILKSDTSS